MRKSLWGASTRAGSQAALALFMLGVVVAGCGGERASLPPERAGERPESLSHVSLALHAPGPDGRTYRLPSSSFFHIEDAAGSVNSVFIGGPQANVVFTVQVGTYAGRARDESPAGDRTGSRWQLLRENGDGTTNTVSASLLNPDESFTVVAGQTTHVALNFVVHGVGDVVFVTGKLDVRVAVTMDKVPATGGQINGELAVTSQRLQGSAALNDALRATPGTTLPVQIAFRLAGPWLHRITSVCNNVVDVTITTGGEHDGLRAFISEVLTPSSTSLCIFESGFISFNLSRNGAATSALASELPGPHAFSFNLFGTGPAGLWDGTTLTLSQLNEPTLLGNASAFLQARSGAAPFPEVAATGFAAPVTLQFLP